MFEVYVTDTAIFIIDFNREGRMGVPVGICSFQTEYKLDFQYHYPNDLSGILKISDVRFITTLESECRYGCFESLFNLGHTDYNVLIGKM